MAGTYSQIYIQIVFGVYRKEPLLETDWRQEVFQYMCGIISSHGQKPIIVNGVADHVHLFIGIKPSICLSNLVREIKTGSAKFIKDRKLGKHKFRWQEGFGAFSYSRSDISKVYDYIANQETHHHKKTFEEEYLELLDQYEIDYQKKYALDI